MVDVIVPVHNGEKYLKQCMDSILEQDFADLQVICVNDASTDRSLAILRDYAAKDGRVVVVDKKQNGGVSAARNSALDVSTGEYVCFVDCDDRVEPNFVSTMLEAFDDQTAVVSCVMVRQHRNLRRFRNKNVTRTEYSVSQAKVEVFRDETLTMRLCNKMFRGDLARSKRFDEDMFFGEDCVYVCHCLEACSSQKVVHVSAKLYHYNVTPGSLSGMHCSLDNFRKLHLWTEEMERLREDASGELADEFRLAVDSWLFLIHLQFFLFARSLRLKEDKKKMRAYGKSKLAAYKKFRKNHVVFYNRLGHWLFAIEKIL